MTSVCIILSELSLSAGHRTSRHRATARRQHLPHRPFYTIQKRQTDQVSLVFASRSSVEDEGKQVGSVTCFIDDVINRGACGGIQTSHHCSMFVPDNDQ